MMELETKKGHTKGTVSAMRTLMKFIFLPVIIPFKIMKKLGEWALFFVAWILLW